MPKRPADDASDDGVIQDGSASPSHNPKRTKTNGSSRKPNEDRIEINSATQKDENGDEFWELNPGGTRRATLSEFKGKTLVSVREYYESNGKKLPGKKGISMSIEQFSALVDILPQLERALRRKDQTIPRPEYGSRDAAGGASPLGNEQASAATAAIATKDGRLNFEATSDEDED